MIKLDKDVPPAYLSPQKVKELTQKFISTGERVWGADAIKSGLLKSSHSKCAYCECEIQIEDSYMEVEHFKYKDGYKQDVVKWDNLLPSCKRCNVNKGSHDVVAEPIINPYQDDPRESLLFQIYRFHGKNALGESTINILDLNEQRRLVVARFMLGDGIVKELHDLMQLTVDIRLRNKFKGILISCQPDKKFSASAATVLHNSTEYPILRQRLIDNCLWSGELERFHTTSLNIKLDLR